MNLSMLRRRPDLSLLSAALLAGLNACGGGGGSGSPPANPAIIDSGNAAVITREVLAVGLDASAFGGAIGSGGILSANGGSNALGLGMARRRATIQRVQPHAGFGPDTSDCLESGSVVLSGSLASEDTLTPGDSITIDFNNCDDADGALYDGLMRIDVTAFDGDIFIDQFLVRARVTLTDLAITEDGSTIAGDGVADVDLDLREPLISDLTVSGDLLEFRSGSDAWALRDFAITVVEDSSGVDLLTRNSGTGTLEGSGFDGAVDFVTVLPLEATGDNFPATGEVLITGANGATIRATVLNSTNLELAIDLDGDSVVDDTQTLPWSEVGSLGLLIWRSTPPVAVAAP